MRVRGMSREARIGIVGTLLWSGVFAVYALKTDISFFCLSSGQFADLATGFTAPLAFLWLVLGYFQQGKELRQNSKALKLQARELKYQVHETRQLVAATERAVAVSEQSTALAVRDSEEDRLRRQVEAAWRVTVRRLGSQGPVQKFALRNDGYRVSDIKIVEAPEWSSPQFRATVLIPSEEAELYITAPQELSDFQFTMGYTDWIGQRRQVQFHYQMEQIRHLADTDKLVRVPTTITKETGHEK